MRLTTAMLSCEEAQEFLDKYHNAHKLKVKPVKYYCPDEVAVHNKPDDIWVVINRNILDLSAFCTWRTDFLTPVNI